MNWSDLYDPKWRKQWAERFRKAERQELGKHRIIAIIVAIWIAGIICLGLFLNEQYNLVLDRQVEDFGPDQNSY